MPAITVDSPLGPLTVTETDGAIAALDWGGAEQGSVTPLLQAAEHQLTEYFGGRRTRFDLPLAPAGTPFQQSVWDHMQRIPYGDTETYGWLASALETAPRPVGTACGKNPIPIIIPCHRVMGRDGSLTGYSGLGGTRTKQFLLELESRQSDLFQAE